MNDKTPTITKLGGFLRDVALASAPEFSPACQAARQRLERAAGASAGVAQDGGFAVPRELASLLWDQVRAEGRIVSRVSTLPTKTGRFQAYDFGEGDYTASAGPGGLFADFVVEGEPATAQKARLKLNDLDHDKLVVVLPATAELVEDAPAFSAQVGELAVAACVDTFERKFLRGDGLKGPLGVTNAPATVVQPIEAGQTIANTATHLATNAAKMLARMPAGSAARAVWVVNARHLVNIVTATAPNFYSPAADAEAPHGRLLGRPILLHEHAAPVGQVGDILLADWRSYLFASREGHPTSAMSAHARFLDDEVLLRITWRCQGQPRWAKSVTPADGGDSVSPFVALAARA